jgi:hypothetical protein
LSCLGHTLGGFARGRRFLRRRFLRRSFFHSLRPSDARCQISASVVVLAESRHFAQVQVEAAYECLQEHQAATRKVLSMLFLEQFKLICHSLRKAKKNSPNDSLQLLLTLNRALVDWRERRRFG